MKKFPLLKSIDNEKANATKRCSREEMMASEKRSESASYSPEIVADNISNENKGVESLEDNNQISVKSVKLMKTMHWAEEIWITLVRNYLQISIAKAI